MGVSKHPQRTHTQYLAVTTDKDLAVTGIDLGTGKVAQLGPKSER